MAAGATPGRNQRRKGQRNQPFRFGRPARARKGRGFRRSLPRRVHSCMRGSGRLGAPGIEACAASFWKARAWIVSGWWRFRVCPTRQNAVNSRSTGLAENYWIVALPRKKAISVAPTIDNPWRVPLDETIVDRDRKKNFDRYLLPSFSSPARGCMSF